MTVKYYQNSLGLLTIALLALAGLDANSTYAQFYSRQYAVVIGIDKYASSNWPKLSYARKDAEAVAALFQQLGYTVYPLYDSQATRSSITSLLEDQLAPALQKNDAVLFFFAGHGTTRKLGQEEWGYIIPCDGTEKGSTYISMEDLQILSRKMGNAKHQAFIMDCCYGGLLGRRRSGGGVSTSIPNYLEEVGNRVARQILTAGGNNQQVVDGGPNGHSLFAGYFLKAIREGLADLNRDNWITFNELVNYILPAADLPNQTPGYDVLFGHEQGEYLFRSLNVVTPTPILPGFGPASGERRGEGETTRYENPLSPLSTPPAPTYTLRSVPDSNLSVNAVKAMLVQKKFYDGRWNFNGTGPENLFEPKTINNAKIVVDNVTHLMWQQSGSPGEMTLAKAQIYVQKLNADRFAGFADWRLPTLEEAMSLLEPARKNGNLYIDTVFDGTQQYVYTADTESASRVWSVYFYDGYCDYFLVVDNYAYVRAVRRGQ